MGVEPGKTTRVASAVASPGPDVSGPKGIPGKATLTGTAPSSASAIGNRYIEGNEHCADAGAAGCFLEPKIRERLVGAYHSVVGDAAREYSVALAELKLEQFIKKDEELPALLGLLVDVIASHAVDAIKTVVKLLKTDEQQIQAGLDFMLELQSGNDPAERPSMKSFIQGINEPAVGWIVKESVDHSKTALKSAKPQDDKAQALGYMERLQHTSAIAWQHQKLDPPGYATDADLIALFHSFKAEHGHTAPLYKKALDDKIARYLASPASRIGRAQALKGRDANVVTPPSWGGGMSMRDTKVVWVTTTRGAISLYYYKLDAAPNQGDHQMQNLDIPMHEPADERFKITTPVENEFVDVAIARHREIWGTEPEKRVVDETMIPNWKKFRPVEDLNQFVPQKNPDFQRVDDGKGAAPNPTPPAPAASDKPIDIPDALKLK